jgi:hypothetical protein
VCAIRSRRSINIPPRADSDPLDPAPASLTAPICINHHDLSCPARGRPPSSPGRLLARRFPQRTLCCLYGSLRHIFIIIYVSIS